MPAHPTKAFEEELRDCKRPIVFVELLSPILEQLSGARVASVRECEAALSQVLAHDADAAPVLQQGGFFELPLALRLRVLVRLCTLSVRGEVALVEGENACMGNDSIGDSYWHFGGTRLYRYTRGLDMDVAGVQWELLCSSAVEWEGQLSLLASSIHPAEQELCQALRGVYKGRVLRNLERDLDSTLATPLRHTPAEEEGPLV